MNKELLRFSTNEELTEYFVEKYSVSGCPIPISFKALIPQMNRADRYTHLLHSYPAKLLVHIPYFFCNNDFFSKKGDLILDPFCGTGTVLLEANLAGRNALGADANPLARLIASVKTKKMDGHVLNRLLDDLLIKSKRLKKTTFPNIKNFDFWFAPNVQVQLAKIQRAIEYIGDNDCRAFFQVCFSNCIKKVSYADPRIAVPVKLNPYRFDKSSCQFGKIKSRLAELEEIDVFEKFRMICLENINRINSLPDNDTYSKVVSKDAKKITNGIDDDTLLKDDSVDFIITSPPYAGAQKYIRSSSLNLAWLGMTTEQTLKQLDEKNIGRENYLSSDVKEIKTGINKADKLLEELFSINKLRAYIVGNYLLEMQEALDESIRVLRTNGYLVLVIGNNKVCGFEFNTQEYLSDYLQKKGLLLQFKLIDDIKSYGLMTKRNKTADIISREWILVFKKSI